MYQRHRGAWRTLWILSAALLALAAPARSADVFFVASYHETDACGLPQYTAMRDALQQGGFGKVSQKIYYLNARKSSKQDIAKTIAQIKQDIRSEKPRIVLTMDDAAFALLYEEMLNQPDTSLVFSGLNRDLEYYNGKARFTAQRTPTANITGVFENLFMRDQLSMLEAVFNRELRKVAILYSTDAVGIILKDQILAELAGSPYEDSVVLFPAEDVPTMLAHAQTINDDEQIDAYVPVTMSVPDPADGQRKTMDQLAPMLTERIRKIDLALNDSFTSYGFFGGVSIDFYQMGFQAGFIASKLLKGGSAQTIPIEDARRSIIAVNRTRLKQLDLHLDAEARGIVDKWVE